MRVRTQIKTGASGADAFVINWGTTAAGTLPGANKSLIPDKVLAAIDSLQERLTTSARLTGVYDAIKREAKPWLKVHSFATVPSGTHEATPHQSRSFAQFDAFAQRFAQRRLDPLFDQTREQQRRELNATRELPAISDAEKEVNRRILISLGALGFALAGELLFAPLLIPAVLGGIYASLSVYGQAYRSLVKKRKIDLSVLGGLNMIGTWLGGFITAGTLGMAIYLLGHKLISKTEDSSRQSLVDVFGKQPRTAWMVVDGIEVEVPFERINAGDTLVVQAGQAIPADGVITHGVATIDQHTLTGEAQPIEKGVGDAVFATTVVLAGSLHVRVEKAGSETTAAQITDILNRTGSYQMAIESKALQLANRSVLPTLIASGAALPIVGYQGAVAITNAAFGFNIKMTGPIAMLNYLNIAAHQGILIKDGRSLELLHTIDTVIFDKTGTLTLDQPEVVQIHPFNGSREPALLAYTAAVEDRQTHPIARAIVNAARAQRLALPPINDASYEVGYGIKARINGNLLRVGSDRFMALEKISLPSEVTALKATAHGRGHSLVMVALDDKLAGAIELEPTIRPEAQAVIADLHRRGKQVYIISGDHEQPTRTLAERLGIDHYFANTLPEEKAGHVARLQAAGRTVCFVGDGINDSIALKKAQVSVSLRGATSVATDTAQVVLMDTTLNQLPALFDLTGQFDANMKTGFAAALIPGFLIIGGVFVAHLGIIGSMVLYNASLIAGLGVAMAPLYQHRATFRH
jgi:Cu2+-exporting ATPase